MRITSTLFALLLVTSLNSCAFAVAHKTVKATGPDVSGRIEATSVTEIDSSQAIIVNYTVGETVSVKYTVPQSLEEYLEITCTKGELKCKFQDGINFQLDGRKVIVDVTAPNVSDYDASSASQINVTGILDIEDLEVSASSASSINIQTVRAAKADVEASSAATVTIEDITLQSCELDSSSSGNITVSGSMDQVNAEASSASTMKISGECNVLNATASSASSVNATGARISTGNLNASSGASIKVSKATGEAYRTSKSSGGSISIK